MASSARPETGGCAQHQQDFTRFERTTFGKRVERGEIVGAESGGGLGGDAVGDWCQRSRRHRDVFGKRAGPRHAHDGLTGCEAAYPAADGIDNAGEFRARRKGQGVLGLVETLDLQPVDEADAGGLHLDAHLSRGDIRQSDIPERDVVDGVILLDDDGFHAGP